MARYEDLPPPYKFHWWQRAEWIRRRVAVLIAVGCLPDNAQTQAEGEWRLRNSNRR